MIFSLKILKNYIYDVIFGAVGILSTGSLYIVVRFKKTVFHTVNFVRNNRL